MSQAAPGSPAPANPAPPHAAMQQLNRQQRFGVDRCVDLHCHCLPGVDDGPPTMDDAIALCRLLVRDGFTDVVATPHELGRWDGTNWAPQIRPVVQALQAELRHHRIPLRVHPGAEIRIDERIPKLLAADQVLTVADRKQYLLLELPPTTHVHPETAQRMLSAKTQRTENAPADGAAAAAPASMRVILAHAERYESLARDPSLVGLWVDAGVVIQVNASSLMGPPGSETTKAAWAILEQGFVSLVATDAHSVGSRRPRMNEAVEAIARRFGEAAAAQVCGTNPLLVLDGKELPEA